MSSPCPDLRVLQSFARGEPIGVDADWLESHLSECDQCVANLESQEFQPPRFEKLHQALASQPAPVPPVLQSVIRRVAAFVPPPPDLNETRDFPANPSSTSNAAAETSVPAEAPSSELPLGPPERSDEIGRLGGYRVLKVLGKGGMGMVFLGEDIDLHRFVALKVMLPRVANDEQNVERFLREAKAMAAIRHPHVVTIYQVGKANGAPFLAMEHLEGAPLDRRLKEQGKLTLTETLRLGRQLASGLMAVHSRGLIHRDLKPSNLWLESVRQGSAESTQLKILDFGLARLDQEHDAITQSGAILGTPAYMAPEQARGEATDARSDLFSVGCILYEMATGVRPFQGGTVMSVLANLAVHKPPAPTKLVPELPKAFSDVVMALLEKDPAKRPGSIQELSKSLENLETPALLGHSGRSGSNRGQWIAAAAASFVMLLLAGILITILDSRGKKVGEVTLEPGTSAIISNPQGDGSTRIELRPKSSENLSAVRQRLARRFVVHSAGEIPIREAATLSDALAMAQSGDTIDLEATGEVVIDPIFLGDKALTLRAGKGHLPRLALSDEGLANGAAFIRTAAPLTLEGITFDRKKPKNAQPSEVPVIHSTKAPVHVSHSQVEAIGSGIECGIFLQTQDSPGAIVENCILFGPGVIFWTPLGKSQVTLKNNYIISARTCVYFTPNPSPENTQGTLRTEKNIIVSQGYAGFLPYNLTISDAGAVKSRFDFSSTDDVLDCENHVFECWLHGSKIARNVESSTIDRFLRANVQFRAANTVLKSTPPFVMVSGPVGPWHAVERSKDEEWEAWDLPLQAINYQPGRFLKGPPSKQTLTRWSPVGFLLRNSPDISAAGIDLDALGPGAPYARWRASQTYRDWRKRTGNLMIDEKQTAVKPWPKLTRLELVYLLLEHRAWVQIRTQDQTFELSSRGEVPLDRPFEIEKVTFRFSDPTTFDEFVGVLSNAPEIKQVLLSEQPVTSRAVENLKGCPNLEVLALSSTQIQDDALAHMKSFPKLRELRVYRTPITDAGLRHLEGLRDLRVFNCAKTSVTEVGLRRLAEKLPRCKMDGNWQITPKDGGQP